MALQAGVFAMAERDDLIKLHIHTALGDRSTRVGVLIFQTIVNSVDLIDEQPTAVIEAVGEHAEKLICEQPKSPRNEFRTALKNYCQYAVAEAKTRERKLYYGLTGVRELDEGCEEMMKDHELKPKGPEEG
jgi:hypothetical protein